MTTVTTTNSSGIDFYWDLQNIADMSVIASGATSVTLRLTTPDGSVDLIFTGTFTLDGQGRPATGTITQLVISEGAEATTIATPGLDVAAFNGFVTAHDTVGLMNALFGGADTLTGGAGNDDLMGRAGADVIHGAAGSDRLRGGDGDDSLFGDADNDVLYGQAGDDTLNGGDGDDALIGGSGADTLHGGNGDDLIITTGGTVLGGGPYTSSTFVTAPAADVVDGGAGSDTVVMNFTNAPQALSVSLSDPTQQSFILYGAGFLGSFINVEMLVIGGGLGDDHFIGWNLADQLSGGAGSDILEGGAGNDTLNGDAGDDLLYGGSGTNVINGGAGVDTAYFTSARSAYTVSTNATNGATTVTLIAGGETHQISGVEYLQFSDVLSPIVGTLVVDIGANVMTGTANFDILIGAGGDDLINGGALTDWLDGGLGDDTINGDAGNDIISGGPGNDTLNGGAGIDQIFGGDGADHIIGGDAATDVLLGDAGDDVISGNGNLFGGIGNDSLTDPTDGVASILEGGDGDDALIGVGLESTAAYGSATGSVNVDLRITTAQNTGPTGFDTLTNIWNLIGGAYEDQLTGDGNANLLQGNAGDDVLLGLGGADTLLGGIGDDVLDGGSGLDTASWNGIAEQLQVDLRIVGPQFVGFYAGFDTLISIENVTGGNFDDTLTGDGAANVLTGLVGNDTLNGNGGNDTLDGGAGSDVLYGLDGADTLIGGGHTAGTADYLYGGVGDDTYFVNSALNPVFDLVFEGALFPGSQAGVNDHDTIHSQGAFFWDFYSVGEALVIDNVVVGGAMLVGGKDVADKTITGSAGTDLISVYAHNAVVDAGAGTDAISFSLYGLDESYRGHNTVVMKAGSGTDYVYDFRTNVDKIDLSAFHFGITGDQVLAQAVNVDLPGTADDYCYFYLTSAGGVDNFIVFMGLLSNQLHGADFVM